MTKGFKGPKGQNQMNMMKQLQQLQQQIETTQAELAEETVEVALLGYRDSQAVHPSPVGVDECGFLIVSGQACRHSGIRPTGILIR